MLDHEVAEKVVNEWLEPTNLSLLTYERNDLTTAVELALTTAKQELAREMVKAARKEEVSRFGSGATAISSILEDVAKANGVVIE